MRRAVTVGVAVVLATWAGLFVPAPWGIRDETIPTCHYGASEPCVSHTLRRCVEFYMPGVTVPYAETCREVKP